MKGQIPRIAFIFTMITIGVLLLYVLISMSTFFISNFVDIPTVAIVAYSIAILLTIIATIIVVKDVKKVLISVVILLALTIVMISIYIVIVNWEDFVSRIFSLITIEFAMGYTLAVAFAAMSIICNHIFFKKKK
ncbi:MAG: hypothetical protein U0L98_02580 [Clostridia bacterium]|nr:hypothetical protein [Clostridia bacterium]